MPLLLLPPPPVLSVADLVFAARKIKWQVEQPVNGLPQLQLRDRDDIALYGEPRAVSTWAAALNLSLIGPDPDWPSRLPDAYRRRAAAEPPELEIRFFCLERGVATWCAYARGGAPLDYAALRELGEEVQQPAVDFVTTLLNDGNVPVPPAFVLDVGAAPDGVWSVLRALPASIGAKFYAPPAPVLPVLRRATLSRRRLRDDDRPWVLTNLAVAQNWTSGQ